MRPTYLFQYFDISEGQSVGYLRGHPGYSRFESIYAHVQAACDRYMTAHPDPPLLLILGRHMRLGPEPPWVAVWAAQNDAALAHLQAGTPVATDKALTIAQSEELWEPVASAAMDFQLSSSRTQRAGLYYAAWLAPRPNVGPEIVEREVNAAFGNWIRHNRDDRLVLFLRRAKNALPESKPSHFVLWQFPSFAHLDEHARWAEPARKSGVYRTAQLLNGAIYRDFGTEQL